MSGNRASGCYSYEYREGKGKEAAQRDPKAAKKGDGGEKVLDVWRRT